MDDKLLEAVAQVGGALRDLTGISSWVIAGSGDVLGDNADRAPHSPFVSDYASAVAWVLSVATLHETEQVFLHENRFHEFYAFVRLSATGAHGELIAVIGPTLSKQRPERELVQLLYDRHVVGSQDVYLAYFASLPVLPAEQLARAAALIYTAVYQRPLDVEEVVTAFYQQNAPAADEHREERERVHARQYLVSSFDMAYEDELHQAIVSGDSSSLASSLGKLAAIDASTLHDSNALRSAKDKAIASVTLASRWAIEGGLDPVESLTHANGLIQLVEAITDIRQIAPAILAAFEGYASRVRSHQMGDWSAGTRAAVRYIRAHVLDNPTVPEIASAAGFSASYLTRTFTHEVGMSPQRYVLETKVAEAKRMLRLTDYGLAEIADVLGFTDQSHFTKRFREVAGTTPAAWRRENRA